MYEQSQALLALQESQAQNEISQRSANASTRAIEGQVEGLQKALEEARILIREQQLQLQQQLSELQRVNDRLVATSLQQQEQQTGVSLAWRLAEVEGLLGLAQQHLVVTRDGSTAIALMQSADAILESLSDSTVFPVRSGIARDIAQIRGMPDVDVEGLYLRLSALADSVNGLAVRDRLQDQLAGGSEVTADESGWLSTVASSVQQLFSVRVRKLDGPLDPMLTPEQAFYLKTRVQLHLEEAQQAARLGDENVYRAALDQAADLLGRYFLDDQATANSISAVRELRGESVAVAVPAANTGLIAARQLLAAYERGQDGGENPR